MNTSDFPHRFPPQFLTAFFLAVLLVFPTVVRAADADTPQGHALSHAAQQGQADHRPR